jgi:hypothetical protein
MESMSKSAIGVEFGVIVWADGFGGLHLHGMHAWICYDVSVYKEMMAQNQVVHRAGGGCM